MVLDARRITYLQGCFVLGSNWDDSRHYAQLLGECYVEDSLAGWPQSLEVEANFGNLFMANRPC